MAEIIGSVRDFFENNKIELFSVIPFDGIRIINQNKFARSKISRPKSVIVFAIPYLTEFDDRANVSLYARSKDYHLFFSEFFKTAIGFFQDMFKEYLFCGYADNSFIDERQAAVSAGLGVMGKNRLVITEKYGSFVFLGEIITDMPTELFYNGGEIAPEFEKKGCIDCGICKKSCPLENKECSECLSQLTQKKGDLSKNEIELMVKYNTVWGCDICQMVCPMNKEVQKTPIEFFYQDIIPVVDCNTINNMDEDSFNSRAYSWRGRQTVLRNITACRILKKENGNDESR